jgi:hypothetical protein
MVQIHPALGASARMTWKVVSFPLIAGLLLLKPIVDAICGFVLTFGLVAAIAFELSAVSARFPFLQVAGIALGFGLFAALYQFALGSGQGLAERLPRQPGAGAVQARSSAWRTGTADAVPSAYGKWRFKARPARPLPIDR